MSTTSTFIPKLSQKQQDKLNDLHNSRILLAMPALALQIFIMFPLMRSFLFIVGLFNLPAIVALLGCMLHPQLFSFEMHKTTKVFLKVGMAKAVGGVLFATYLAIKFFGMVKRYEDSNALVMTYIIPLIGSTLVDIIYSALAHKVIRKTRRIIRTLRGKSSTHRRVSSGYAMRQSSDSASCGSASCSEEESSEKSSQSGI
jgi:predicted membrane protein